MSPIHYLLIFILRHLDFSKNVIEKGVRRYNFIFITPPFGVILMNFKITCK
jgi:hypothetical protein